jgi:hypothetical protein
MCTYFPIEKPFPLVPLNINEGCYEGCYDENTPAPPELPNLLKTTNYFTKNKKINYHENTAP